MFGEMNVIPIADLRHKPEEVGGSVDGAIAKLLDVTEHPRIAKWVQFPKALFVFLVVPGDPESGAFYIYDRRARVWFWLDFDDEKFGGYTASDFDRLVRECRFLDIVEHPHLLPGQERWVVQPGLRPQRSGEGTPGEVFIKMAKEGSTLSGFMDGLALSISVGLQYGVPLKAIVDKLTNTRFEPSGFTENPAIRYSSSALDYIARWLGGKFISSEYLNPGLL